MAGFWLSASDGLVISSESLFGEVGRECPGLREEEMMHSIYRSVYLSVYYSMEVCVGVYLCTSVWDSTLHLNGCRFQSVCKSH